MNSDETRQHAAAGLIWAVHPSAQRPFRAILDSLGPYAAIIVLGLLVLGWRALRAAQAPDKVQRFVFRGGSE